MIEVGTKAPDFELPDQNGELHKLSEYLGKKVILKNLSARHIIDFIPRRKLRSAIRTRLFFSFDLSALRKYLMNQPLLQRGKPVPVHSLHPGMIRN